MVSVSTAQPILGFPSGASPFEDDAPQGPPPMRPHRGPMSGAMRMGPRGKWWSDPATAQRLGLTADQQKKMDDLFQESRLKLIDLSAALQKQEAILEPLLAADRPDEAKVLSQIDRVAQARAELEKANARMLLGIRNVLTPDQWKRLQAEPPRRFPSNRH
ncbi:MAG: Spy/CpxP family protein refolding chaperone [Bryobacteraceae bacterium]